WMNVPNCLLRGSGPRTTDDPPKSIRHVGRLGPRLKQRMHVGDALHHPVPVAHQLRGHPQGHDGNPEPMREGVIHRRLVFPVRAELRPIVGDGHSVIHQPALRLDVQRYCRHRLGDGEHRKECVSIDLPPSGYIGEATPDIDDLFAIHVGHYLQADLAAFADGGVNGFLDHAIWALGYANSPTTLVSFNYTNGSSPAGGLIADANGNLFSGPTSDNGSGVGEACTCGAVFEIVKTASGYASTPTFLYSFCAQANCKLSRA